MKALISTISLSMLLTLGCSQKAQLHTRTLVLTGTSLNVYAWGLTMDYPTDLMDFVRIDTTGTLVGGWYRVGAVEENGQIIMGGFDVAPITSSGHLIKIIFSVKRSGHDNWQIHSLVDDIEGATVDGNYIRMP
jgi:hypothetical protein